MRIYVERSAGYKDKCGGCGPRGIKHPDYYDCFDDVTDQPMPTVTTRLLHIMFVPEPGDVA